MMKPKRRYKKYTQNDFAELLGIEQSQVSRLLNGKEKISWPLALKLSKLFPGKDQEGWHKSGATDLCRVYAQLKYEAERKTA